MESQTAQISKLASKKAMLLPIVSCLKEKASPGWGNIWWQKLMQTKTNQNHKKQWVSLSLDATQRLPYNYICIEQQRRVPLQCLCSNRKEPRLHCPPLPGFTHTRKQASTRTGAHTHTLAPEAKINKFILHVFPWIRYHHWWQCAFSNKRQKLWATGFFSAQSVFTVFSLVSKTFSFTAMLKAYFQVLLLFRQTCDKQ